MTTGRDLFSLSAPDPETTTLRYVGGKDGRVYRVESEYLGAQETGALSVPMKCTSVIYPVGDRGDPPDPGPVRRAGSFPCEIEVSRVYVGGDEEMDTLIAALCRVDRVHSVFWGPLGGAPFRHGYFAQAKRFTCWADWVASFRGAAHKYEREFGQHWPTTTNTSPLALLYRP